MENFLNWLITDEGYIYFVGYVGINFALYIVHACIATFIFNKSWEYGEIGQWVIKIRNPRVDKNIEPIYNVDTISFWTDEKNMTREITKYNKQWITFLELSDIIQFNSKKWYWKWFTFLYNFLSPWFMTFRYYHYMKDKFKPGITDEDYTILGNSEDIAKMWEARYLEALAAEKAEKIEAQEKMSKKDKLNLTFNENFTA